MSEPLTTEERNHLLDSVDTVVDLFGLDAPAYLEEYAAWLLDEARLERHSHVADLLYMAVQNLMDAAAGIAEADIRREFADRDFDEEFFRSRG